MEEVVVLKNWQELVASCDYIDSKGLHFKDIVIDKELFTILTTSVRIVFFTPKVNKKEVRIYELKELTKGNIFKCYNYFLYLHLSDYDVLTTSIEEVNEIYDNLVTLPMMRDLRFIKMLLREHEL